MSWNYRILKRISEKTNEEYYCIHEVFYKKEKITAWTKDSVSPCGCTVKELKEDIEYFLKAFDLPVLEETIIDGEEQLIEEKDLNK